MSLVPDGSIDLNRHSVPCRGSRFGGSVSRRNLYSLRILNKLGRDGIGERFPCAS